MENGQNQCFSKLSENLDKVLSETVSITKIDTQTPENGGFGFQTNKIQIMGFYVQIKEGFSKGNSKKSKKSCFFVISSPNSSKTTKVEQVCNSTLFLTCSKASFPTFKNFEMFHTKKPIYFENHLYSRLENVTFTFGAQNRVKNDENRFFFTFSKNFN